MPFSFLARGRRLFLRRDVTARLFGLGLLVGAVGFLRGGFLARLGNVRGALSQVFAVFLLLLDDFLIVLDVAGIGHTPSSVSEPAFGCVNC